MIRLGVTLAVNVLAGDDPGQEMGLLPGRAVRQDRWPDEPLAHAWFDPGYTGSAAFLGEDEHLHEVNPLPP